MKKKIINIKTENGVKKKAREATYEQKTIWWLYTIIRNNKIFHGYYSGKYKFKTHKTYKTREKITRKVTDGQMYKKRSICSVFLAPVNFHGY